MSETPSHIIESETQTTEQSTNFLYELSQEEDLSNSLREALDDIHDKTKVELELSILENQWEDTERLIWTEGIKKAQEYFWIEPVDWEYSYELFKEIVNFQRKNWLKIDWIIWPNTLNSLESKEMFNVVPWAENINEIFEEVISSILNNYIWQLETLEWINLSKEKIYEDLISILRDTNNNIDEENIFWKDLELIIKNFLEPKEKWIKLVEYFINKILKVDQEQDWEKDTQIDETEQEVEEKEKISWENLDDIFSTIKDWINFLFDSVESKTPEQLQKQISELKNIKEIKEIFEKFPDIEKLLIEIIPSIVKNTDRQTLLSSFDNFYSNIKEEILMFLNWTELEQEQMMNWNLKIFNNFSNFLWEIVNEEQVDILTRELAELSYIKNNDNISSLLDLVNDPNISKSDKLELTKKIISWLKILSKPEITDEDLDNYIKELSSLIKDFSWKIPDEKLKDIIKKFYWLREKWEGSELSIDKMASLRVLLESENAMDIAQSAVWTYVKDASKKVVDYLLDVEDYWRDKLNLPKRKRSQTQEEEQEMTSNVDDYILDLIRSWKIDWVIDDLWWKVVDTIRDVVSLDVRDTIEDVRDSFLSDQISRIWELRDEYNQREEQKKENLWDIEENIVTDLINRLTNNVKSLLLEKISSNENNNLTKEELINLVLNNLRELLSENTDLIEKYLKEFWISLESKEDLDNITDTIEQILDSPKTNEIILQVIINIWKQVKWDDIAWNIRSLIDDSIESKWQSLLDWETKSNATDLLIDTFFDNILKNESKFNTFINIMEEKTWYEINVEFKEASKLLDILNKYIWKEQIKEQLLKHQEVLNWNLNFDNFLKIFFEIYDNVKDKTWFINTLIDNWYLEKIREKSQNKEKKWWLDLNKINIWIDLIYSTIESSSEQDVSSTINRILEEYSLDKLLNIQIFWKNLSENIVSILKCIDKNDLKDFVKEFKYNIEKLNNRSIDENEKIYNYSVLWTELFKIVDVEKFKSSYNEVDLPLNERLFIDLSSNIQEIIRENNAIINDLVERWKDINDIFKWKIDINQVNKYSIESYWRQVFDLLNKLVSSIDEDYFSNLDFWKKQGKVKNSVLEIFIDAFKDNNFKFIVKEIFSWIFWWFNKWRSIDNYFRDISNKSNFWETLYTFLEKK